MVAEDGERLRESGDASRRRRGCSTVEPVLERKRAQVSARGRQRGTRGCSRREELSWGSLEETQRRWRRIRPEPEKMACSRRSGGAKSKLVEGFVFWSGVTRRDADVGGRNSSERPESLEAAQPSRNGIRSLELGWILRKRIGGGGDALNVRLN